ncbi:MAG: sugar phosphate isomerase/epimerase [Candidatus Lokiarchaeota archaeon]|nr:sugar phosphate isomerase/epimerase [Candidatus Lokiarchaeota archaeon]
MELGISSLGNIIDSGLSSKYNDLFSMYYHSTENCLKFAEDNEISIVEIVLDPQNIFTETNKQEFIELINSYQIKKQIHGPFIDINLCSHNDIISKASTEAYIETAKFCKEINVKVMTIHPGLANFLLEFIRDYNRKQLAKAINTLLNFTNNLNLNICLENMPKNTHIMLDQDNIQKILSSIGRSDLFLTYDTSHFYTNDGDVNLLWEKYQKIIKNVHLVENYTTDSDTHPPLGTGKVDFKAILETIRNYQYKGALIVELSSNKDLSNSIDYINKLL